jgi:predicted O-methyltransferase YrrM
MQYDAQPPSHYEYHTSVSQEERLEIKRIAFSMMNQLEGWCSNDKASILIDLVLETEPSIIVEIGVFGGKSLVPMAYAQKALGMGKTYGIDPWDHNESIQEVQNPINKEWWGMLDHGSILHGLQKKIKTFDLNGQVELIQATSAEAMLIEEIDILHIDGNHSEATSTFDVLKWVPLVRSGGWIVFDDMGWSENGINTTARAVNWLNTHCVKCAEFNHESTWGIWVKP